MLAHLADYKLVIELGLLGARALGHNELGSRVRRRRERGPEAGAIEPSREELALVPVALGGALGEIELDPVTAVMRAQRGQECVKRA